MSHNVVQMIFEEQIISEDKACFSTLSPSGIFTETYVQVPSIMMAHKSCLNSLG